MGRRETLDRVRRKEITVTDAAKLEGVSRTRITQLLKKNPAKPSPAAAPPPVVVVQPRPMGEQATPPPAPTLPPPGPGNLADVLAPLAPAPGASPVPGPDYVVFTKIPLDAAGKPLDPDHADNVDAGRELLGWIRRGVSEFVAKVIYKANPDDPRLDKLKEENKFLKVSLKRNQDKAAPLGALTAGWWGLAIGFVVEMVKVATTFPAKPSPAAGPKPPAPSQPSPADPGPSAPDVRTVQEVRKEIEEGTGPKRLTTEERIALMNRKP